MRSSEEAAVVDLLKSSVGRQAQYKDALLTNDRVIARVTDGIYRQPGSAIRELIANAFDADATKVVVNTEAPRFSRMTVEDDGKGMSVAEVVHLLRNIGGSAKRTRDGSELGVSAADDVTRSPGGRKLIGKLGIGLFSVSQLTHDFQIITKVAGERYRTVAAVKLRQFDDRPSETPDEPFKAGDYVIWREKATDLTSHGTTIALNSIRPHARRTLQSDSMWRSLEEALADPDAKRRDLIVPTYHIGRLESDGTDMLDLPQVGVRNLPWSPGSDPSSAFKSMVDCVWDIAETKPQNAKLSAIFDSYLQMIWDLALALPMPYVDGSLSDQQASDWAKYFRISNARGGSAVELEAESTHDVGNLYGLDFADDTVGKFEVTIDGIQLSRPIRFRGLPRSGNALSAPLVFGGKIREEFSRFSSEFSAGPLEFDGYLMWTPKVAPSDHQGVLVRINGSSGTLFDSTFFGYKVSENTRLRQVTGEIFVRQGLEAALNIDRESFNTSHPHTVLLMAWIHSALRQLATVQKREGRMARSARAGRHMEAFEARLSEVVESAASNAAVAGDSLNVRYSLGEVEDSSSEEVVFSLDTLGEFSKHVPSSIPAVSRMKVEALLNLLSGLGILDELDEDAKRSLAGDMLAIVEAERNV
jgi:hypothetical protein